MPDKDIVMAKVAIIQRCLKRIQETTHVDLYLPRIVLTITLGGHQSVSCFSALEPTFHLL